MMVFNNKMHSALQAIALLGLLFSCTKELESPETALAPAMQYTQIQFEAIAAQDDGDTKTTRNSDGSISWLPSDEINVFCGREVSGRFISDNTEVAASTTFTGHFNTEPTDSQNYYWAIYPYMSTNSCDGSSVTLSVPSAQISSQGTFGPGMFPSVARSNNTKLSFYNVCGLIKFTLSRGDIDQITLSGNDGEVLAGSVRVSFGSDGKPKAEALEGSTAITLKHDNGGCFEKGQYYYFSVLPVTMNRGFTMTFHTENGNEGTLESSKAVTIRRSIASKKDNIDAFVSDWHESSLDQDITGTGVYLGILAFNQALYSYPVTLLTSETIGSCESFIDGLQMKNGTILYYAADNGLQNMQQGSSPKSLAGASLVTFTDGLDQGSIMMNPDYGTEDKYLAAISNRIHSANVFGEPLSAFSIGIKGNDVQNTSKFKENLVKLASSEQNAYEISSMSELESRFNDIAAVASVSIDYSHNISLTIPGLPDGTRVRFTFDNVSNANSSNRYIEGTFNLRSRMLTNVSYKGLTSSSGSSISGSVNDIFVKFNFQRVHLSDGRELSADNIQQWQSIAGSTSWQKNSEFDSAADTDIAVSVSRKSAIVYLVLDCSSSLGSQFSTMKNNVKKFIRKLYNDSYIETSVSSVRISPSEVTIEKGQTRKLSALVYPATALNRAVKWSSDNSGIVTVNSNGVVSAVSSGSTYVYAETEDGGHRASCNVTVYTLPDQLQGQNAFTQSGLYLGILAFNQGLYRYPITRLTTDNVDEICSFIDNNPLRNGSLVYYAAEEAVSDIKIPSYPSDLSDAVLVTFTDALDQGSLMKKTSYNSNAQYLSAVKQRIDGTIVNSRPLTAYSIGIRGGDVEDISEYKSNLEKLASTPANAYEITDIGDLQSKLNDIANVVSVEYTYTYTYTYDLTVTVPGIGNGSRIRLTFDNVSNASQSKLYIEGTFNLSTRSLTNVVYQGFSTGSGQTVSGTVNGIFVTYTFTGLRKADGTQLSTNYLKEWTSDSSQSSWQINSEFDNSNDASTDVDVSVTTERKSAMIYLILDYSTSIGSKSSNMKSAAKNFVRALQKKSYDPYSVASVSLDKTELTLLLGNGTTLYATVLPYTALEKGLVWTSSNESVATVDQSGKVTAVGLGQSTITATTVDGGKTATCEVTVNQLAESLTLDKTSIEIYVGDEPTPLMATILPEDTSNKSLTWSSSNQSVATVDEEGKVTAVSNGSATITVKTSDGSSLSASCSVTVRTHVTSITLDKSEATINVGGTLTLYATIAPSNASNKSVTWSSDDTSIATVNTTGKITAVSRGLTTITAKTVDGEFTASCSVTVLQKAESITLDNNSLEIYVGDEPITLTATVLPENTNDKSVTWTSSNNSVATVDENGKVTGVFSGKITITVKTNDGSDLSDTCEVTVKMRTDSNGHDYVDLGLPSGLKWATMNVGATKPEKYGDYFAWGETETEPKYNYWWSTYKWCDGSSKTLTKYNNDSNYGIVDNKTVLDSEDDVAHVNWGGSWRMPTNEEWTELRVKCTWIFKSQNGINGRKVTGPNGKSIFLPAAGDRDGTNLDYAGSYGYYWSSSLTANYQNGARGVYFNSYYVSWNGYDRYYGFSVRPVSE